MFPQMKFRHDWIRSERLSVLVLAAALVFSAGSHAAPPAAARAQPREREAGPDNTPNFPPALGSSAAAYTTSMEVLNSTTKLGARDRVNFRIVEDRREPITLVVTDSGEMEVPLIGRVNAAGKTCKQLAYEIKPLFEKEYFVKATVIIGLDQVGTKSRGKVFITGQVRGQGALELMPGETVTVSQAILRAGGVGDFADKRRIRLVRKKEGIQAPRPAVVKMPPQGFSLLKNPFRKKSPPENDATETIIVDLVDILEYGHLERDPELQVGDLIFVPERLINF